MPVRPSKEPNDGSLSHNGETGDSQRHDTTMGDVAQAPGHNILAVALGEAMGAENDSAEEDEDEGVEEENNEGRVAIGRKSPKDPTKKDREEHELIHTPYRSWCEHCVRSRARNAHHRKRAPDDPLEEVILPRVHMDYSFMSREHESASNNPLFVMADEKR